MLILTDPIRLTGKFVVSELASTDNTVQRCTYSPYSGKRNNVNHWWPGTLESTDANIALLFDKQVDFDADSKLPTLKESEVPDDMSFEDAVEEEDKPVPYNPYNDTLPFTRYYRRLEDIDTFYIESYIENLVMSIRMHSSNGLREYNYNNAVQPTLMNTSGDDEFTELADLQLEGKRDDDWSAEAKQEAAAKLPYVLKRLHTLSCYCGIHMLSFIASYIKAKELNLQKRSSGSVMTLKVNALYDFQVYRMSRDGNSRTVLYKQNRNPHAQEMFDWLEGNLQKYQSYYRDYKDYVHYCDVLNIDVTSDDMITYITPFIDSLVVTCVTPNTQYNQQIFERLCQNQNTLRLNKDTDDVIQNTISLFDEAVACDSELQTAIAGITERPMKVFINDVYKMLYLYNSVMSMANMTVDINSIRFGGNYATCNGSLLQLCSDAFGPERYIINRCLLSTSGYLVVITETDFTFAMSIYTAIDMLNAKLHHEPQKSKWRRLQL